MFKLSWTAMRDYLDLQPKENLMPTGPFSRTVTKLLKDMNGITASEKYLPDGIKEIRFYDDNSGSGNMNNVTKVIKENPEGVRIVTDIYSYDTMDYVEEHISALDGTTNYHYGDYNERTHHRLSQQSFPAPSPGGSRLETFYGYNSYGFCSLEYSIAGSSTVSTAYLYDDYANLTQQIEDYDGSSPKTSSYAYNVYNERTQSIDPEGNVVKTLYDSTGALAGKAKLDSSGDVLSGWRNTYNSDGWITVESVLVEDEAVDYGDFENDVNMDDILNSPALNWVHTVNQYDQYGRKTAVINDYNGRDLTTQYYYNNQSEVTKIVYPDGREKITERDGRGLVVNEINQMGGVSSTTSYYYDLNGNRTKKVDPEDVTEIYQYDGYNRLIRTKVIK